MHIADRCVSHKIANGADFLYCTWRSLFILLPSSIYFGPKEPPQQFGRRSTNNIPGGAVELNVNESPHVNKDCSALFVLMSSICWWQTLTGTTTSTWTVFTPRRSRFRNYSFSTGHYSNGHKIIHRLRDYWTMLSNWTTAEQLLTSFYNNTLKRGRFLHFTENNRS
jgi:hypothetical protein